jgi:hypothetical protein
MERTHPVCGARASLRAVCNNRQDAGDPPITSGQAACAPLMRMVLASDICASDAHVANPGVD